MRKLLKNEMFKSLLLTLLFGAFYALLTFIVDGFVEIDKILTSMVFYFLFMCLLYFIAPKLRKITGHEKDSN